ncbi:DNA adenine methylase [Dyella sp. OK004]|uniref:DNA adenine methylase n=1 Tax=Dyella sp. OK004 TaxID=1855292 RepID=UPI0008E27FAC|nr:Dam family site-specific DNA-(adenine-N6)-methyltransferase [Dyella sp. OK004]SFS08497.1 DNA adenine methylase [Dyella sp. OK004]
MNRERTAGKPAGEDGVGIVVPFLKWPGGKRWLAAEHRNVFPKKYKRYVEPFLGSASVFFALQPERALLSDANEELITTYRAIRSRPKAVMDALNRHALKHCDTYYYEVRSMRPTGLIERAARLIYLNRTCFNGIYRVNLEGVFNVPRGTKNTVVLPTDDFHTLSRVLHGAELENKDFEEIIDQSGDGDFVFADPPYTVRHNTNGFIKYNEKLFSWADQERLAAALARARRRGARIVATNANHSSIRELYAYHRFAQRTVSRFSSISATSSSRKQFEELVILGGRR